MRRHNDEVTDTSSAILSPGREIQWPYLKPCDIALTFDDFLQPRHCSFVSASEVKIRSGQHIQDTSRKSVLEVTALDPRINMYKL